MTGRKLQLAAGVLIFSMALAACTGCGAEDKDSLETLYLEDGSHDKEEAMQEHSDEEMTSDGAEENKKTGASGIQGVETQYEKRRNRFSCMYVVQCVHRASTGLRKARDFMKPLRVQAVFGRMRRRKVSIRLRRW